MTVDVEKLLCDSIAKLEAFTRQRRELDLHRYLLIDIMMRKIETAALERRNPVAQESGNTQNDGGEPQRPCSSNADRHRQVGLVEHSQMLMAEGTSERDSVQRDIVLDGDSMAANADTDSATLTSDEGIHPALGRGDDVPRNLDLFSKNSVEAPERSQYEDTTTFKVEQDRSTLRDTQEYESQERQCLTDDSRAEQSSAFRAQEPAASATDTRRGIAEKSPKSEDSPHFDSGGLPPVETRPTSSCGSCERLNLGELLEESTARSHSNGDDDKARTIEVGATGSPRTISESVDSDSQNSSATLERSDHEEICSVKESSEEILSDDGGHECEGAQEAAECATGRPQQPVRRLLDWSPGLKRPRSEQDLAATKAGKRLRCSSESALSSKGSSNNGRDLLASGPCASSESIDINLEVIDERDSQLARGDDADEASDAPKVEDAPLPDLFDFTVLKSAIVSVDELPITSNLLELPDQQTK
ncbi:hypothetical protein MTO96_034618 [Rhipicephalus appendiculatus]